MNPRTLAPLVGLLGLASVARAGVTFEYIGEGAGTAISADGTVIAGNTSGVYETFRWTEETGIVPLGMSSVAVLGRGAGTPDISADGTRISATILGMDSTYVTQGLWTLGQGWQETMPPVPIDGGLLDEEYGSAWGLSDDGETLVGLYWRPGASDGSAHASRWSPGGAVMDLGSNGGSSRANDANADGSVIVGWAERFDGTWQPTVWTASGRSVLTPTLGFCEAAAVTPDGTMITGATYDEHAFQFSAAAWDWDGSAWTERVLGRLPGTSDQGYVTGEDMTADGSLVVGYNAFFFGNSTGFLWTEETGMVDVEDFLADHGIIIDPFEFDITDLTAVSDDGTVIVGVGRDVAFPFPTRTFLIRLEGGLDAPEITSAADATDRIRAWPNPTRGATSFSFELPRAGVVELAVYDPAGRLVRRLSGGGLAAGRHEVTWNGRDESGVRVAAGVYFYRLDAAGVRESRKLVLVR